jgi:hypothetical protein
MAAGVDIRPDAEHVQGAPDADRDLVNETVACVDTFEKGIGQDFHENCRKWYRQYRGFKKFRNAWEAAGPNDRDGVVYDAQKTWGANLHIPLSFRTIETMVPRAIAQRPRMLYLPRAPRWEENVESVQMLIDSQQEQIDIELEFQDVMRSGFIYGLGIGKAFWRREYAPRRQVRRSMRRLGAYYLGPKRSQLAFDDPDFENIDVFDFMWDPYADGMDCCGWAVHRSWLSLEQCLQRIQSGLWNTDTAKLLDEDAIRRMSTSGQKYDEIWQDRMEASGLGSFASQPGRGEQVHELLEWHNGDEVYSVLDRQAAVQQAENQCVGSLPFQTYRPTKVPKQMVGIGELEPLEHLQRELDTLRSQRRDAATLALCAGYAYDVNAIDEDDLVFGPALAIAVRNARPQDAIMPIPVKEPPGTSYQEEQVVRTDFDAVSGINDALAGGEGTPAGTATEAQLVQAAVSVRVELKSRRFEVEVVRRAARCFLHLNQRMILSERPPIRQPGDGLSLEQAYDTGRWQWFPVGPGELQGDYEIIPEGGSMAAPNVPQMRQDFGLLGQLEQNPHVDQRKLLLHRLKMLGIKDPEGWLTQEQPPIPPATLEILQQMGTDPRLIQFAVTRAQQQQPLLPPGDGDQEPQAAQSPDQMAGQE